MTNKPDSLHKTTIIERVQKDIVAALKTRMGSEAYIDAFPARPESFQHANYKLCALVHYSDGAYGRPSQNNVPSQPRALAYTIVLILSDLDVLTDAYRHIEAVRHALQWQRMDGAGPVQMLSERMVSEEKGRWEFHIKISVPTTAVAAGMSVRPAFANNGA